MSAPPATSSGRWAWTRPRKRGIGAALTLACMHGMREMGYGYAIIGAAGPEDFYTRVCGAEPIADSKPGIYRWQSVE